MSVAWPEEKHATASVFVLRRSGTATQMAVLWHQGLGKWLIPGGHVEANETAADAARREVLEEIGVRVVLFDSSPVRLTSAQGERANPLPLGVVEEVVPSMGEQPSHVHIDHLFAAAVDEAAPAKAAESEPRWVELSDLPHLDLFRITRTVGGELLRPGSQLAAAVLGE